MILTRNLELQGKNYATQPSEEEKAIGRRADSLIAYGIHGTGIEILETQHAELMYQ